ncbi:MAG: efflux RND transporter permease subunit [Planctomycetota bacterium]
MQNNSKSGKTFYDRWGWLVLLLSLACVPFAYYGAGLAVQSNVNKVEDWLPKSYRETDELARFRKNFPSDQFIIVSWDGCQLGQDPSDPQQDDPRIAQLIELVAPEHVDPNDVDAVEAKRYFKGAQSGRTLLTQLTTGQHALAPEEAVERLKGAVLGPDGRQTCVIVSLDPSTSGKLKPVLGHGQQRIFRPNIPPGVLRRLIDRVGIPDSQLHLGGPPVDNISIDEEGERTLVRLAGFSGILGLFLAWWSLRSFVLTWIVFLCSVTSAASALAMIWATGETVDAIVLSMPSLVYVLAISGAVHFINYYQDAVHEGGLKGATERAVIHALKPAVLCSLTTAFGLLSLCSSELVPIRKFGLYSASGVMILNFVLFLILPATLHLIGYAKRWELSPEQMQTKRESQGLIKNGHSGTESFSERFWGAFSGFIVRNHFGVALASMVFCGAVGLGLFRIRTSIDLLELFDSQARILKDYRWLETHLGKLVPMEIVLEFNHNSLAASAPASSQNTEEVSPDEIGKLSFLERMETTLRVQEAIQKRFGEGALGWVGRSLSAATFAPSLPTNGSSTKKMIERSVYNSTLESKREDFMKSGFLRVDTDTGNELWRISLRVAAFEGVDYGQFVHELHDVVEPVLQAQSDRVQILRRLAAWSGDTKFVGKKVILWDPEVVDGPSGEAFTASKARSDEISNLLKNARLKVARATIDSKSMPLVQLQELEDYDAIVLAGAFSNNEVRTLETALSKIIDLESKDPLQPKQWVSSVFTGVVPIVYKAQRALLTSLMESTLWSFLTITPLMIFVSRSFRAGMVAMIPNIVPVIFIFGLMGWLGIAIDIGSMMTASIALGVAVDDTIHFLSWFRGNVLELKDRRAAIIASYKQCGTPTLQAACISGLGLSVFAFSTFTPTQRFGWLMLTILVAGVIAELVLLPAILAGPLGCVFDPKATKHSWWSRFFLIFRHKVRRRFDSKHHPSDPASEAELQNAA